MGGEALQQILEDRVVGAVPHRGVEFQIRGDSRVVFGIDEVPVSFEERFQTHEVGELAGVRSLGSRFLFEQDAHVVDLDDLLRVNLGNLQPSCHAFEELFLLQARERLPDRCSGDAEPLCEGRFAHGDAGLVDSRQDLVAEGEKDALPVHAC